VEKVTALVDRHSLLAAVLHGASVSVLNLPGSAGVCAAQSGQSCCLEDVGLSSLQAVKRACSDTGFLSCLGDCQCVNVLP